MRSQGTSTSSAFKVFTKSMAGVAANQSKVGPGAIMDTFQLQSNKEIKPTCSGKLLSSQFFVTIFPHYDFGCDCCTEGISVAIPIVFFIFKFRLFSLTFHQS